MEYSINPLINMNSKKGELDLLFELQVQDLLRRLKRI